MNRGVALFLFFVLLVSAPLKAGVNLAAVPIGRMDLPWWRARFFHLQAEKARHRPQLIWIGDSITADWERAGPYPWADFAPAWKKYYGRYDAMEFGFVGDDTASVLWRIAHGELDGLHPKVTILLIGANNFGAPHWGWRLTVGGIEADVNAIHAHLPQTHIFLLGVLPSDRGPWVTRNTKLTNRALAKAYAKSTFVSFRNVSSLFYRRGQLDRRAFLDSYLRPPRPPLHPTARMQAKIAATIAPEIARLMAAP